MGDNRTAKLPIVWDVGAWQKPHAPDGGQPRPGEQPQLRELLEALPAAVYTTDEGGQITFYNQAAVEFSGRTPEIGRDHWCVTWRLYWPDGRPMAHEDCPMARALKEDRAIRGEEAIAERPDGTRVPFTAYPTPLHDTSGKLVGAVNMLMDLSDRKRAEPVSEELNLSLERRVEKRTRKLTQASAELRESERRFRYLSDGVTDYAIFVLDPQGTVTKWNSGAERIKGYRANEIIGQHFSRFYTEEDQQSGLPDRALKTAARDGRFEAEGWRLRKDGSRFWANVVMDAIHDEAGVLIGFAKVTRDMTERRAVEEQLHQARKMEAVGQLTNGVAHDFNNVLAAIIPNLELAHTRVKDKRVQNYIKNAMHAADQGAKLTNQLLGFSRRNNIDAEPVDVDRLISEACAMLPRTIGPTIAIERVLDGDSWRVLADPGFLELAILNLAINARDAMSSGGTLTISTTNLGRANRRRPPDLDPGDYVTIAISDTGKGMAEHVRSRAFEPFFTTKAPGKGTGLGLSMVYGFAKRSGGTVTIDSELGKGTTIGVYLPRAQVEAAPPLGMADRGQADAGPSCRVLVVDDDTDVRTVIIELLRAFGHRAAEALNGAAALDLLQRDRGFDLLMIDLAMPNMDGLELAAKARQLIPSVRILFVTGRTEAPESGAMREAEMLKKPFRQIDLAEKLRSILCEGDRKSP